MSKCLSGIYTISSPSGKLYIGSAINLARRKIQHFHGLRNKVHANSILQKAFNKYGEENLIFKEIIHCSVANLLLYEQIAIDAFEPAYNIAKIAGSSLGIKRSESTKMKLSLAKTGVPRTEQAKQNIRDAVSTPEARKRNSDTQKAIHGTPEMRKANSERQKEAQNRPEVRAKKGRSIICVETKMIFTNGHEAAEWCLNNKLTKNKNAFVAINCAVRKGKPIYGFNWSPTNN